MSALITAAGLFALLMLLNISGVRRILPYFIIAVFLWYAMYLSGVHATLAGVLGAFSIPARPKYNPDRFSRQVSELMDRFNASHVSGQSIMSNDKLRGIVQTLSNGVQQVEAPLQRLEHSWHLPVAYLVIPIFALFNAGIPLDFSGIGQTLSHPVTANNSTENIYKDCFNVRIFQNNSECYFHPFCICRTAYIKEVCRFST